MLKMRTRLNKSLKQEIDIKDEVVESPRGSSPVASETRSCLGTHDLGLNGQAQGTRQDSIKQELDITEQVGSQRASSSGVAGGEPSPVYGAPGPPFTDQAYATPKAELDAEDLYANRRGSRPLGSLQPAATGSRQRTVSNIPGWARWGQNFSIRTCTRWGLVSRNESGYDGLPQCAYNGLPPRHLIAASLYVSVKPLRKS